MGLDKNIDPTIKAHSGDCFHGVPLSSEQISRSNRLFRDLLEQGEYSHAANVLLNQLAGEATTNSAVQSHLKQLFQLNVLEKGLPIPISSRSGQWIALLGDTMASGTPDIFLTVLTCALLMADGPKALPTILSQSDTPVRFGNLLDKRHLELLVAVALTATLPSNRSASPEERLEVLLALCPRVAAVGASNPEYPLALEVCKVTALLEADQLSQALVSFDSLRRKLSFTRVTDVTGGFDAVVHLAAALANNNRFAEAAFLVENIPNSAKSSAPQTTVLFLTTRAKIEAHFHLHTAALESYRLAYQAAKSISESDPIYFSTLTELASAEFRSDNFHTAALLATSGYDRLCKVSTKDGQLTNAIPPQEQLALRLRLLEIIGDSSCRLADFNQVIFSSRTAIYLIGPPDSETTRQLTHFYFLAGKAFSALNVFEAAEFNLEQAVQHANLTNLTDVQALLDTAHLLLELYAKHNRGQSIAPLAETIIDKLDSQTAVISSQVTPHRVEFGFRTAQVLCSLGLHEKARHWYQQLLDSPESPLSIEQELQRLEYARVEINLGNFREAFVQIGKHIQFIQANGLSDYLLARAHYFMGQLRIANSKLVDYPLPRDMFLAGISEVEKAIGLLPDTSPDTGQTKLKIEMVSLLERELMRSGDYEEAQYYSQLLKRIKPRAL